MEFQADGHGGSSSAWEVAFTSPVSADDAADLRWLLEDYPRLGGSSADPIAARATRRLQELAGQLGAAVFGSPAEATAPNAPDSGPASIRDVLARDELLRRLHVRVEEAPDAPWIPWELLPAPGRQDPLSVLAASFSRSGLQAAPEPPRATSGPLRGLLVVCRPRGTEDVGFRSVASRIVQAVSSSGAPTVRVDVLRPPTFAALGDALDRAREAGAPYDIVHFDGHGTVHGSVFAPDRERGYLRFENEAGEAEEVAGSALGDLLRAGGVRWLLLNACRSAYGGAGGQQRSAGAAERAFGSLAGEVRAAGVPGVLAMGFNVYVVTAARLIADTYAALGAGWSLGEAVAHARRRRHAATPTMPAGPPDWLIPVSFESRPGAAPVARREVPELPVRVSTTTASSPRVVDPEADSGARSAERPFFGYDDLLLRLDRACTRPGVVELIGLAGSGKSALAGEFARWWVATGGEHACALVLEPAGLASLEELERSRAERLGALPAGTARERCLTVLEDVDRALDDASRWPAEDRARLRGWIAAQAVSASVLLTGRSAVLPAASTRLVLGGLEPEATLELAASAGFSPEAARAAPAIVEWTRGLPAAVLQLPHVVRNVALDRPDEVRALLWQLHEGKTESGGPELGMALVRDTGLEFFDVRHLRSAALPIALGLFQGHVSHAGWHLFCQFLAAKGLELAPEGDAVTVLRRELSAAERAGLACALEDAFLLHPLAPICIEPGFAGTMQALTGGDPDRIRQLAGLLWSSFVQTMRVSLPLPSQSFGSAADRRSNLWFAVELATMGEWWGLAFPLLRVLRDELVADGRLAEWRSLLDEVLASVQRSPPREQEMGPESAELHLIRLLADELERDGDAHAAAALRELQLRVASSQELVLEPEAGAKRSGSLDAGRLRRIGALLKQGDSVARSGAAECLRFYEEALRLAEEARDDLRMGEAQLAIARAHLNVQALRDPAAYERYARLGIESGQRAGPLGHDLVARGKLSLGNAIAEDLARQPRLDPARVAEARACLRFAATAEAAAADSRAHARIGLGNLDQLQGDYDSAAREYLAACAMLEDTGQGRDLLAARANAVSALAQAGRQEDARQLAQLVLAGLEQDPGMSQALLPMLRRVLPDVGQ